MEEITEINSLLLFLDNKLYQSKNYSEKVETQQTKFKEIGTTTITANDYQYIFCQNPTVYKQKAGQKNGATKKSSKLNIVIASVFGGTCLLLGTYIVARDEFIIYRTLKIDNQINKLSKKMGYNTDYINFRNIYDDWKKSFEKRTVKKFRSKCLLALSTITTSFGLIVGNNVLFFGIGGIFVSSSYLLWTYLTSNKIKEKRHFQSLLKSVENLKNPINQQGEDYYSFNPHYNTFHPHDN